MNEKKPLAGDALERVTGGRMDDALYEYFREGIDNADHLSGVQKTLARNKLTELREDPDRTYEDIGEIFAALGLEM